MVAAIGPDELLWLLGAIAALDVQRPRVPVRPIYIVTRVIGVAAVASPLATDDTLVVAPPVLVEEAPMLRLRAMGAAAAEAILATFWLPAERGT